jgi:threonine/homoserine/homoserine lactone efflux protein
METNCLRPLLQGLLLGFSIAAPVGPIGVLCIRYTLEQGWRAGLTAGLGAASADMVYGAIAAFGITVVSNLLVEGQVWLRAAGGLFLLYLGLRTFFRQPALLSDSSPRAEMRKAYWTTFGLTLTNPMTILSFAAVIAGLGDASTGLLHGLLLVAGVFLGSSAWWLLLSSVMHTLRARLSTTALVWINRASGVIILGFSVLVLRSLV